MADITQTQTLGGLGLQTVRLFEQVKAIENGPGNGRRSEEWPRVQLAAEADRFDLWSTNLGLFVSGHGSLDYRVRDADTIRFTLLRFMTSLNEALSEVIKFDTEDPMGSTDDEQGGEDFELEDLDSDSDMVLLIESVKDPIDRLFKLSIWIRKSSTRFSSAKAHRYKLVDPETEVDLLEVFRSFDRDYITSLFQQYRNLRARSEHSLPPSTNADDPNNDGILDTMEPNRLTDTEMSLVSRLSHANTRRRQQFAYWKNHRDKLSLHAQAATGGLDLHKRHGEFPVLVALDTLALKGGSGPEIAVASSVTTASRLNLDIPPATLIRDDQSNMSVSEYATSVWKPGNEMLGFPPAPKHDPGVKFFECPYCFTLCSSALRSDKAWRAHLIHDLRPYICTYEHCRNHDQLYDSIDDWIQHENCFHRNVFCCPEHPDQEFATSKDLQSHLNQEHSTLSKEAAKAILVHGGTEMSLSPDRCCPICTSTFTSMKELNNHIARHLERFSLFALPRSAGEDDSNSHQAASNEAGISSGEGSRDDDFDGDLIFDDDHKQNSGYQECLDRQKRAKAATTTGNLAVAVDLRRQNLIWCKTNLSNDPMHEMTVWHQEELAACLAQMENFNEALVHIADAYDSRHAVSPDAESTLTTLDQYAFILSGLKRFGLAARKYETVWKAQKATLGEYDPLTLNTCAKLATCWFNHAMTGNNRTINLRNSRDLHQEILTAMEKETPADGIAIAMVMNNLARDHMELGDLERALELTNKNLAELRQLKRRSDSISTEEVEETKTSTKSLLDDIQNRQNMQEKELLEQQQKEATKRDQERRDREVRRQEWQQREQQRLEEQRIKEQQAKEQEQAREQLATRDQELRELESKQGMPPGNAEEEWKELSEAQEKSKISDALDEALQFGKLEKEEMEKAKREQETQVQIERELEIKQQGKKSAVEPEPPKDPEPEPEPEPVPEPEPEEEEDLWSDMVTTEKKKKKGALTEEVKAEDPPAQDPPVVEEPASKWDSWGTGKKDKKKGKEELVANDTSVNQDDDWMNWGDKKKTKKPSDALIELEVQVMETCKIMLGADHPDTLTSMSKLASTYSDQGQWKEAELLEVQVMETRKRVLGEEHPDTLTSMANLASMFWNQGRWKEAESLEVQVMETRKRVLGEEHPDTLTSMANLANMLESQGKYEEAEQMHRQALLLREKVLGKEHLSTLNSINNLANVLKSQGKYEGAEQMYEQALYLQNLINQQDEKEVANSRIIQKGSEFWAEKISLLEGELAKEEMNDRLARKDLQKFPNDVAANKTRAKVRRFKYELDFRMRYYEAMQSWEAAKEDKNASVQDLKKLGEVADLAKILWELYEAVKGKEEEKDGTDDGKEKV